MKKILLLLLLCSSFAFAEEQTYVVQKGDNLWSISNKFLVDPYKWIDLWKINPEVSDPHWIYPGNVIKIPGEAVAAEKPKAAEKQELKEAETDMGAKELTIYAQTAKEVDVEEPAKPKGKKFILDVNELERLAFFSEKEIKSPFIVLSALDKITFGEMGALFYIDGGEIKGLQKDMVLPILRPFKRLKDEMTRKQYGYLYLRIGYIKIVEIQPTLAVGKVVKVFSEVQTNDFLFDTGPRDSPEVVLKKSRTFLEGKILDVQETLFFVGDRNFVFIDKGKSDGLDRGDVLILEKHAETIENKYLDVGRMVIVKTWDTVSAAYIVEVQDMVTAGFRFSTYVGGMESK